ncbi:replicative helicase loader/inhibitor [Cohnella herbarum]|uniref:Replicative helicase inhibitor G39P N-terminal domain-containing protein n=1 Tax=Cohnella herbarum TaxID=2728023 RepID=A0A7Z2ZR14_9BACL|nr:replicative helicase loader/inhibitor [Cohnella herbarum]QJD87592.1 hypothetical protein HH215_33370 [Cohnella herbarum]
MKETEVIKIMAMITTAYPSREWDEKQTKLWVEMLTGTPYYIAQDNVVEHIKTSKFPPTIAEVIQYEPEISMDPEIYHRNKQIAHQQWVAAGGDPEAFIFGADKLDKKLNNKLLN